MQNPNIKKIQMLVEVLVPEHQAPDQVQKMTQQLMNAGLRDALDTSRNHTSSRKRVTDAVLVLSWDYKFPKLIPHAAAEAPTVPAVIAAMQWPLLRVLADNMVDYDGDDKFTLGCLRKRISAESVKKLAIRADCEAMCINKPAILARLDLLIEEYKIEAGGRGAAELVIDTTLIY